MPVPTATGLPRSISPRPCSTCSSTKHPMRRSVSSSRPTCARSCPAADIASAIDVPSPSRSPSARSRGRVPVTIRDPAQAMPNRAPSSSPKFTTPTGRDGRTPAARSASIVSSPLTTPSGPSKAPPSGTESRCEPTTTPGPDASGSPHHAHWLPGPVDHEVEPPRGRLAGEPLAQGRVGRCPGVAAVPAGRPFAADWSEVVPEPVERHERPIGTLTPPSGCACSGASSGASPESMCRMTPMPGSLVSTRSILAAASGVPSATVTWPA